jgi:hypothetical protein
VGRAGLIQWELWLGWAWEEAVSQDPSSTAVWGWRMQDFDIGSCDSVFMPSSVTGCTILGLLLSTGVEAQSLARECA